MGSETVEFIESRLEGKFQLEINRDKTQVVNLREQGASPDFPQYTFRYDRDRKGRARKFSIGSPGSVHGEIERYPSSICNAAASGPTGLRKECHGHHI